MVWKTFLIMYFIAGDGKIADIAKKVESIGLESAMGPVDFVYEWPEEPTKEQILELADKIREKLNGMGVVFNIDTHQV